MTDLATWVFRIVLLLVASAILTTVVKTSKHTGVPWTTFDNVGLIVLRIIMFVAIALCGMRIGTELMK